MSSADAERFANDLASNQTLLDEVKAAASGLGSIVTIAKSHGYDFSVDEAKEYIKSQSRVELTDQQLEAVAGGKGDHVATSTQVATSTVQTVEGATTAVVNAEGVAMTIGAAITVAVSIVVLT